MTRHTSTCVISKSFELCLRLRAQHAPPEAEQSTPGHVVFKHLFIAHETWGNHVAAVHVTAYWRQGSDIHRLATNLSRNSSRHYFSLSPSMSLWLFDDLYSIYLEESLATDLIWASFSLTESHKLLTNHTIILFGEGGETFAPGLVPRKARQHKVENKMMWFSSRNNENNFCSLKWSMQRAFE